MIGKEDFKKLITEHLKWMERIDEVSNVLKIDPYGTDWIDYSNRLYSNTLSLLFTDEAIEDIEWWMYEKGGNPEFKMWGKDGNEIPTETVDDLWEIIKDNRK